MTIDELRAKAFKFPAAKGDSVPWKALIEPIVLLADAEAALAECEREKAKMKLIVEKAKLSAIDPWAEIARLQKELDAAVAYHDECGELIEAALDTDARKYNEGSTLFQYYALDIRRIRRERDSALAECQRENAELKRRLAAALDPTWPIEAGEGEK